MQDVLGKNQGKTIQAMSSGNEATQIQKAMLFKIVFFTTTSSAKKAVLAPKQISTV